MAGPFDYATGILAGVEAPGDVMNREALNRQTIKNATLQYQQLQQAAQKAMADQKALAEARERAIRQPSAANYAALAVLDPKSHEGIKSGFDLLKGDEQQTTLRELSAVRGYLRAGKPEAARAMIQRRIDADRKAGQDVADDEQMLALIAEDAEGAAGMVDFMLAGVMGPDKWAAAYETIGKEGRANEAAPGDRAKTAADTAKLAADAAKAAAETAIIPTESAARVGLMEAQAGNQMANADKLGIEAEQLATGGKPLSPVAAAAVNTQINAAASSRALADRATGLADQIATVSGQSSGGLLAAADGLVSSITGGASDMRQLRREYMALNIQQAIKNLPPGPASDKDVKMAQKGFPPDNANAETLISYLRGVAKVQQFSADADAAKADWMSQNDGSLGKTRAGIFIGNDFVEPGQSFDVYLADKYKAKARERAQEAAGAKAPAPARPDKRGAPGSPGSSD